MTDYWNNKAWPFLKIDDDRHRQTYKQTSKWQQKCTLININIHSLWHGSVRYKCKTWVKKSIFEETLEQRFIRNGTVAPLSALVTVINITLCNIHKSATVYSAQHISWRKISPFSLVFLSSLAWEYQLPFPFVAPCFFRAQMMKRG